MRPGEGAALVLSFLYFFFLLGGYYLLRPVRETMGVEGGVRNLPWLYMGTLIVMIGAQPLFGALVSRVGRRVFIPATYRFFLLNILGFYAAFTLLEEGHRVWAGRIFYVWVSVFNLFAVTVFWGFMSDIWRSEQGKRLFGRVAAGGSVGALVGAGAATAMATKVGESNLLLFAAASLEICVWCMLALSKRSHRAGSMHEAGVEKALPKGGAFGGIKTALSSRYLLAISLYLLLFTVTSTVLYFAQARIVAEAFGDDRAARTAGFAAIDFWTNVVALVFQGALTGLIVRRIGVGWTLTVLPMVTLIGMAALAASPVFLTLLFVQAGRRGLNYGLTRPAREALFTVVAREDKYKAKSFIDTFIYRGGDAVGAWTETGLRALGVGAVGLAWLTAPVVLVWAPLALWLGRRQRRMAEQQEAAAAA